jgi:antitoxin PrlF
MLESTITGKGQTTIPVDIRSLLKLKEGDKIQYVPRDGGVFMRPKKHYKLEDLFGILPKPKRHVSDAEIKASIEAFWTRKFPKPRRRKNKS